MDAHTISFGTVWVVVFFMKGREVSGLQPMSGIKEQGGRPRKRVRVEESANEVTDFNCLNPVVVRAIETIDYAPIDAKEAQTELQQRLVLQQLSPEKTGRLSNNQQAFSVFQIPVVLDTKLLTLKELKSELSVRGLRVSGPKEMLVRRLDHYIREKEPKRLMEK